jgi:hypothetical protein
MTAASHRPAATIRPAFRQGLETGLANLKTIAEK